MSTSWRARARPTGVMTPIGLLLPVALGGDGGHLLGGSLLHLPFAQFHALLEDWQIRMATHRAEALSLEA